MNPYLFVYGTLKLGSCHPVAEYLHQFAEFLGEGKMPGVKYDLGAYPGASFQARAKTYVEGHIFKMHAPHHLLQVLDDYEGIGAAYPPPHEYIRTECPVVFGDSQLRCWVYLYNLP